MVMWSHTRLNVFHASCFSSVRSRKTSTRTPFPVNCVTGQWWCDAKSYSAKRLSWIDNTWVSLHCSQLIWFYAAQESNSGWQLGLAFIRAAGADTEHVCSEWCPQTTEWVYSRVHKPQCSVLRLLETKKPVSKKPVSAVWQCTHCKLNSIQLGFKRARSELAVTAHVPCRGHTHSSYQLGCVI